MSRGVHAFKEAEVSRAVKALRKAGLKIDSVQIRRGSIEFQTSDGAVRKCDQVLERAPGQEPELAPEPVFNPARNRALMLDPDMRVRDGRAVEPAE
jgi:hypothetical protein